MKLPDLPASLHAALLPALAAGASVAFAAKPIEPATREADAALARPANLLPIDLAANPPVGDRAQFDATPTPLPPNVAGLGFEATGTSELGDLVRLGGTSHGINRVTVTLSSGAARGDFPGSPAGGFTHPLTLKIFAVDRSGPAPRPGPLLVMLTQSFLIPWRPEPAADGGGRLSGVAFNVTFDLTGQVAALPDEIIYSIGFSTQHHGSAPLGVPGPYDSLRLGVTDRPAAPSGDVEPDAVFWKNAVAANYADGGAAGVGEFRRDTGWAPARPAVRFTSSAFGTLAATAALLRGLHSADPKIESTLRDADGLAHDALNRKLWNGPHRLSTPVGFLIFEILSEAADQLADLAQSRSELAPSAQRAIAGLMNTAESVTAAAAADALRARGDVRRIARAKAATTGAGTSEAQRHYGEAIDQLGDAWRDLQLAVP